MKCDMIVNIGVFKNYAHMEMVLITETCERVLAEELNIKEAAIHSSESAHN